MINPIVVLPGGREPLACEVAVGVAGVVCGTDTCVGILVAGTGVGRGVSVAGSGIGVYVAGGVTCSSSFSPGWMIELASSPFQVISSSSATP